jgi:hypothetical protein
LLYGAPEQHADIRGSKFENPDWSHLTIERSDGRKIHVHKSVLCSRNDYFDGLFGLKAPTAVSPLIRLLASLEPMTNALEQEQQRKTIKFEDNEPSAVRSVIRKVYGQDPERWGRAAGWKCWFERIKVATKFQEPAFATQAEQSLLSYTKEAYQAGMINEVCDVLHNLHEIDSRPQVPQMISQLARLAHPCARDHERFRAYVFSHPDVMMELVVEGLNFDY